MNPNEIDSLKLLLDEEAAEEGRKLEENAGAGVRRHFRENSERCLAKVSVQIEDRSYGVLNLSMAGVGLKVKNPQDFPYRNNLLSLALTVGKKTVLLQGRVIHLSAHDSGDYICGIDFCDPSAESTKVIAKLLAKSGHK